MIKLTKKIIRLLENESIKDCTCVRHVFIDSHCKPLKVHLYALMCSNFAGFLILRYFSDGSYNFFRGYVNLQEVADEFANQVNKLV